MRNDDAFWMNGNYEGRWSIAEILKILCPRDKDLVDDLAQTEVVLADDIYYDDPYYDGEQWITKRFTAAGSWNGETLLALTKGPAEDGATTFVHELVHKHQPASMSWRDAELDAFIKTEQWSIDRGLPGQGSPVCAPLSTTATFPIVKASPSM